MGIHIVVIASDSLIDISTLNSSSLDGLFEAIDTIDKYANTIDPAHPYKVKIKETQANKTQDGVHEALFKVCVILVRAPSNNRNEK
jgi:hypothetical protein